jgi:hypothetical protein
MLPVRLGAMIMFRRQAETRQAELLDVHGQLL